MEIRARASDRSRRSSSGAHTFASAPAGRLPVRMAVFISANWAAPPARRRRHAKIAVMAPATTRPPTT
ncbi:hypothetical protein AX769_02800 [Frondihabitans sp. PAMC 28766]|nr:hypothetical protein AX769_02800 [Frondihabitans sp. PAMC 28766]